MPPHQCTQAGTIGEHGADIKSLKEDKTTLFGLYDRLATRLTRLEIRFYAALVVVEIVIKIVAPYALDHLAGQTGNRQIQPTSAAHIAQASAPKVAQK